VVFVRLKPEFREPDRRGLIAEHTRSVLGAVEMVRELRVATAAEERTAGEQDIVILLQLDDLAAVEAWRTEATHRAYVDVYLRPLAEKIRVWNFAMPELEQD
jgi:hypothetical protein